MLRPQFLMHRGDLAGQFDDDSRLVSFLRAKNICHDTITDTHLHSYGIASLAPYRCVITGSHPEYYSSNMLTAVREFTATGGRLFYLGANGFCKSTLVSAT
jgi:N,N-dimethylformamidase